MQAGSLHSWTPAISKACSHNLLQGPGQKPPRPALSREAPEAGPSPFWVPRAVVGTKLAPAHGMELDLQGAEAVQPQGRCRPSGNTRALASLHGLWAWQPGHAIRGEGDRSGPPNTQLPHCPHPHHGLGHPPLPGCAQQSGGQGPISTCPQSAGPCLGDPGLPHPHSMPGRPVGPRAQGTRVGPPHSCKASLPPRPGCQLEQKTHPQVAISNRAGPSPAQMTGCGPCSDLPAARCGGERGLGSSQRPGPPSLPLPPACSTPGTSPPAAWGQGDCRGPRYVGAGLWPGVRKQGRGSSR